jgi:hypothetical protein
MTIATIKTSLPLCTGFAAALFTVGVAGASKTATAANYPTTLNVGTQTGLVALYDYDDLSNHRAPAIQVAPDGVRSYPELRFVHMLPDRVGPGIDRESGDYDFNFLPFADRSGATTGLIIDFSLETQISPEAAAEARILYPNATLFYPLAQSGKLNVIKSTPGIVAEFASDSSDLLATLGLAEPVRIHLDTKALRNYRCALDAIAKIKRHEAQTGVASALQEDNLSVLIGTLEQEYKVLSVDPVTAAATYVVLPHALKVSLRTKEERDFSLNQLILSTVRAYTAPCHLDWQSDLDRQVQLPAWSVIVNTAGQEHVDLFGLE